MTELRTFTYPPEPGPEVKKIHPIGQPETLFFRPNMDDGLWFDVEDYEPDQHPSWLGYTWIDLFGDYPDGFQEAEKTDFDRAVEFFTVDGNLKVRPAKVALDHARVLIAKALEDAA